MDASYCAQYQALWRQHWWWVARHRLVLDKVQHLLQPHDPAATTLLDIGCAGGVAFADLQRFGTVYGLEPDPLLHERAGCWRPQIEPVLFDGAYRSMRNYDLILMLDVLEHIEDDAAAAANLRRLLKPNGHVLLTVPALPSLWSVHDEVNHHYRRYRAPGLHRLLTGAGLEVVELRYLFCWSLGLLYLRRWLTPPRAESYAVRIPSPWINRTFLGLSRLEEWTARLLGGAPLGSSLLAIARAPEQGAQPLPLAG
jgi:SAM-dependent methyltransferase